MPALALIITFIILFARFHKKNNAKESFFMACAVWGTLVYALNESLSFFGELSFYPLFIGWILVLGTACFYKGLIKFRFPDLGFLKEFWHEWPLTDKLLLFLIIGIGLIKGLSAIKSAPNTSDAMTYHLNRVEHWIQNKSIVFYPTHVLRQLFSPFWAEYAILDFRILSSGDHFSNAVQWFAAIGSWLGVAGIAQLLGSDRRGQLTGALFAATLPMGLVQATSTQNDYVLSFWLAGFIYFLTMVYQRLSFKSALGAGACLGLAMLTKGNAYVYTPTWIVIYAGCSIFNRDAKRLKLLILVLAVAAIFVLPFAWRNTIEFGKPNWTDSVLTNKIVTLPLILTNAVCNLALHMATPYETLNDNIKNGLNAAAKITGLDIQHPDPALNGRTFSLPGYSTGEDDTGNGLYLVIFFIAFIALFLYKDLRRKSFLIFAAGVVLMFLMFCAVVRYNQFNTRFHLPVFIISCVLVGEVLSKLFQRWVILPAILVTICVWPWLFACNEHPLIGDRSIFASSRAQQYFSTRPLLIYPYTQAVDIIATGPCRDIGLIGNEDEWGYPWWVLFYQHFGDKFRMEDVQVKNLSARLAYPRGPFFPCALITSNDDRQTIILPSGLYARIWSMQVPGELTSVFKQVNLEGHDI